VLGDAPPSRFISASVSLIDIGEDFSILVSVTTGEGFCRLEVDESELF
jgi:hypothetical protein